MNRSANFVLIILVLSVSAFGQAATSGDPANWCRAGSFAREAESFSIGTAKGARGAKLHFYGDDAEDCPVNERCKTKSYVVPGDQVVVSKTLGDFGCAWFTPAKGYPTVGWVRMENFRFLEASAEPSVNSWIGEWAFGDNSINFTHNKLAGFLNVTGDAVWKGIGDNVHVGELDGRFAPDGHVLSYSDGDDEFDCKAKMTLLGKFLVVSDNNRCGGANVSFSGVYRKRGK
jgi:hypothetical protein